VAVAQFFRCVDHAVSCIGRGRGISDIGVKLALERRNKSAPIEAVTVLWWRKEGDELRAALRERNHSKIGRMARLRGDVTSAKPAEEMLRQVKAKPLFPWSDPV
jgi:hypothetical protein